MKRKSSCIVIDSDSDDGKLPPPSKAALSKNVPNSNGARLVLRPPSSSPTSEDEESSIDIEGDGLESEDGVSDDCAQKRPAHAQDANEDFCLSQDLGVKLAIQNDEEAKVPLVDNDDERESSDYAPEDKENHGASSDEEQAAAHHPPSKVAPSSIIASTPGPIRLAGLGSSGPKKVLGMRRTPSSLLSTNRTSVGLRLTKTPISAVLTMRTNYSAAQSDLKKAFKVLLRMPVLYYYLTVTGTFFCQWKTCSRGRNACRKFAWDAPFFQCSKRSPP